MAGKDGTTTRYLELIDELARRPFDFGFEHALRLIECARPDRPRLGESLRPAQDPIRLTQLPSVAFPPSTLAACERGSDRPRLAVHFLGLFGPNGPLPLHLTEYARERLRDYHDPTFVRFLDLFHHRLLSFFYRAWANTEPAIEFDRPASDRFSVFVASLFGLGLPALRDRDAMPDLAKLYYSGRLACQTRSAEGLCAMLNDYLRLPVAIDELVGNWMSLPKQSYFRVGAAHGVGMLGHTATLGIRVWDCQYKFRVTVGPIGLTEYRRLLPGGQTLERLIALVDNYVGYELHWDLKLILKRDEIPRMVLGRTQLGWTARTIKTRPKADAEDLILDPSRYRRAGKGSLAG